MRKTAF